jgi:hypothetical protein
MTWQPDPWDPANDDRPEIRIWLDPTDSGTSILVETDHNGDHAMGAFWQPNEQENNDQ